MVAHVPDVGAQIFSTVVEFWTSVDVVDDCDADQFVADMDDGDCGINFSNERHSDADVLLLGDDESKYDDSVDGDDGVTVFVSSPLSLNSRPLFLCPEVVWISSDTESTVGLAEFVVVIVASVDDSCVRLINPPKQTIVVIFQNWTSPTVPIIRR